CIDEYPIYDILFFDFKNKKIDTFARDIMFFDFEKIDNNNFLFTDGQKIYKVNVNNKSKELIYNNSNSNNVICDIVFINNEILVFKVYYDVIDNKILINKLKDDTAIYINSVPFSEFEYHGLITVLHKENIYFTSGQNLYLLDQNNNLTYLDNNVYELFKHYDTIIYGKYNNNKYEYKLLNLKNKKIDEFLFPNDFNKIDWRNKNLLNINNKLFYFQNDQIFTLSNHKWVEINEIIVYENKNFKVLINNLKETIIEF
ncbi:MAG: hypothetical protein WBH46_01820, partial [Bacteroidales bacterium]